MGKFLNCDFGRWDQDSQVKREERVFNLWYQKCQVKQEGRVINTSHCNGRWSQDCEVEPEEGARVEPCLGGRSRQKYGR